MTPRRWDIWWARWQNDDGSTKERFVLILGQVDGAYLCSYISSRPHPDRPHVVLDEDHPDFPATGLHVTSYLYARDHQRLPSGDLLYRAGLLAKPWCDEFLEVWQHGFR